jgi:hypothetical protein
VYGEAARLEQDGGDERRPTEHRALVLDEDLHASVRRNA